VISFFKSFLFDEAVFRRASCVVALSAGAFFSTAEGAKVIANDSLRAAAVVLATSVGGAAAVQGNGRRAEGK
jgi:hypothetical protein